MDKFAHRYFYPEKRRMVLELLFSMYVYRFSLEAAPTLQAQLLHNKPGEAEPELQREDNGAI